jgi:hypothetical protein
MQQRNAHSICDLVILRAGPFKIMSQLAYFRLESHIPMELLSAAGPRLRGWGTPVGAALSGADDPAAVVGVPEVVDAEPGRK